MHNEFRNWSRLKGLLCSPFLDLVIVPEVRARFPVARPFAALLRTFAILSALESLVRLATQISSSNFSVYNKILHFILGPTSLLCVAVLSAAYCNDSILDSNPAI